MIKINLLPVKAAKKKEKVMTQVYMGILVVIFAVVGLGYFWFTQKSKINVVRTEIQKTNEQKAKLADAKKKFEELQKKENLLNQQLEAITKLDRGRDWFIRVLDKITESIPHKQVWVNSAKFGGTKSRGARGGGGGANNITLRGSSYDRDAVALFMGNLSIIPCDDALPDEEKAPICQERNTRCRRWNEATKNWEWDFEGCRRFYKETCEQSKTCADDVRSCNNDVQTACTGPEAKGGKTCQDAKDKCAALKKQCDGAKAGCGKLHEEEYVAYDSVRLNYIRTGKEKPGSVPVYDFEIVCSATEPSGE
ncbi:MAG TPA: hypothetical protein VM658_16985 [bacterium]|nr:hypothetical protein [bacterium]